MPRHKQQQTTKTKAKIPGHSNITMVKQKEDGGEMPDDSKTERPSSDISVGNVSIPSNSSSALCWPITSSASTTPSPLETSKRVSGLKRKILAPKQPVSSKRPNRALVIAIEKLKPIPKKEIAKFKAGSPNFKFTKEGLDYKKLATNAFMPEFKVENKVLNPIPDPQKTNKENSPQSDGSPLLPIASPSQANLKNFHEAQKLSRQQLTPQRRPSPGNLLAKLSDQDQSAKTSIRHHDESLTTVPQTPSNYQDTEPVKSTVRSQEQPPKQQRLLNLRQPAFTPSPPILAQSNVKSSTATLQSQHSQTKVSPPKKRWIEHLENQQQEIIAQSQQQYKQDQHPSQQQSPSQSAKRQSSTKVPSVFIPKVTNISLLVDLIKNSPDTISFNITNMQDGGVRIKCGDPESYSRLLCLLEQHNIQLHTHQPQGDKGFRVVIKKLHATTPTDQIRSYLAELGFNARYVSVIKHRFTGKPFNMFEVELANNADGDIERVLSLTELGFQQVHVERQNRKIDPVQCHRCQGYGHSKNYCRRAFVCLKCAGGHPTTECTKSKNSPAVCANCNGEHIASYKGCPVFKTERSKLLSVRHANPVNPFHANKQDKLPSTHSIPVDNKRHAMPLVESKQHSTPNKQQRREIAPQPNNQFPKPDANLTTGPTQLEDQRRRNQLSYSQVARRAATPQSSLVLQRKPKGDGRKQAQEAREQTMPQPARQPQQHQQLDPNDELQQIRSAISNINQAISSLNERVDTLFQLIYKQLVPVSKSNQNLDSDLRNHE